MIAFRFNLAKTIQASAVLLKTDPMKRMSRLRLLKLLYIADRESLTERARPITGDRAVAMENGPVLTTTYNLIKGEDFLAVEWEQFFTRQGHHIILTADPGVGDLTRPEIAKLHDVAGRFETQSDWDVVEFTHLYEEWIKNRPPAKTSKSISVDDLLEAIGLSALKDRIDADAKAEDAAKKLFDVA